MLADLASLGLIPRVKLETLILRLTRPSRGGIFLQPQETESSRTTGNHSSPESLRQLPHYIEIVDLILPEGIEEVERAVAAKCS